VVGVEQWAEIRRMHRVQRWSIREISRRTGLHRRTVRRALSSDSPTRYSRAPAGSKLDPFKDWICEQLRADPSIQSLRLREMASELGYEGAKTIFDAYVREVRPRYQVRRTFQRTIYRPGESVQCDLWEAQRAARGRARPDQARVGRDRGAVLVARDRRRAGLLQAGAGHPLVEVAGRARRRR
jgi:transposase